MIIHDDRCCCKAVRNCAAARNSIPLPKQCPHVQRTTGCTCNQHLLPNAGCCPGDLTSPPHSTQVVLTLSYLPVSAVPSLWMVRARQRLTLSPT
jgi:hypothetical protein